MDHRMWLGIFAGGIVALFGAGALGGTLLIAAALWLAPGDVPTLPPNAALDTGLAGPAPHAAVPPHHPAQGHVVHDAPASTITINGHRLSAHEIEALRRALGQVLPGDYWYDATSGLFGWVGQPPAGALPGGRPVGALSPDASGGRTGVYLNGRRLPEAELARYRARLGPIAPGRYWLDGVGNVGIEGVPVAMANVASGAGGPADPWLGGGEWSGEARIGGGSLTSGTVDRSGGGNHVFSVDGQVLDLPF